MNRRAILLLLVIAILVLGVILFGSVRESRLFRLTAPTEPAAPRSMRQSISGTTVTSLTTVSTSALLESPRYTGQDTSGRNWEITAVSAGQQGSAASTTIVLNTVLAHLEFPSTPTNPSRTLTLRAESGSYAQSTHYLGLTGNVQVEGLGLTLTAPHIDTSLAERQLTASGGVNITGTIGPWGLNVTAPLLSANQNISQLTLTGGVHAVLTPQ
ncbi:MAG: hypothetical protein GC129_01045 [Proteobacteria bacterium]|nr:hypothetical protein [Pseudomonadota bacterium]